MRAVVDTCIVIDALQKRSPFDREAVRIFHAAAKRDFAGFITAKSLLDIYYLMHRVFHKDDAVRAEIEKLLILFDLLDTSSEDCRRALSSEVSDFEDAVMVETALRSGARCIVTRNLKDYSRTRIPVFSPQNFLKLIGRSE